MMRAPTFGILTLSTAGLAVVAWVRHKAGKALITGTEALAAAAVVFAALWWLVKGLWWLVQQITGHPWTTLTVVAVAAWCWWVGWTSLGAPLFGLTIAALVDDDSEGRAA